MGAGSIKQGTTTLAIIGTFKRSGSGYTGAITTLSLQVKNVRIVPEETRSNVPKQSCSSVILKTLARK